MFSCQSKSSAKVVDGNLIISLPDAVTPVVWRMALGEARAAALEVRQNNNDYALVLKYPKGDMIDIAPFDNKKTALKALMAISKAMQDARGQIKPAYSNSPASPPSNRSWKWLIPLGIIMIALFLLSRTMMILPGDYLPATETPGASLQDGVPQSADSFLGGM